MPNLCVIGAGGRMGLKLIANAESKGLTISGALEHASHVKIGEDIGELAGVNKLNVKLTADINVAIFDADIVIDFAFAEQLDERVKLCAEKGIPMVIGATGVPEKCKNVILEAAKKIAIIHASNYSVGVNLLFGLCRQVASILDETYDIEVVEMHHKHKKDAPSGTALSLVEALEAGRNIAEKNRKYGREGNTGARTSGEIGIHAIRGGDVVGDHLVIFAADGERIELGHKASNRDAFAFGALRAANYLLGKTPGLYNMKEVLGLKL